ncbi:MAG: HNH endonuclease, partial [Proteobacteria bacterium]|nr:HNH endonuclease [Pseudomonadota bacterium]
MHPRAANRDNGKSKIRRDKFDPADAVVDRDSEQANTDKASEETHQLTLDHVIPRYLDGGHIWENLVSACISCN